MFTRTIVHCTKRQFQYIASPQIHTRFFHPTPAIMVKIGDPIPTVDLQEGSPGNKVNLAKEIASGPAIILGVPAAYSPGCTDHHVPGFLMHPDIKKHKVYVVSVNDAFVMKAWGKSMDENGEGGIRFLADPAGEYTKALDLLFDAEIYFGNKRSRRYTMKTQDGKVTSIEIEEDPSKVTVTSADNNI